MRTGNHTVVTGDFFDNRRATGFWNLASVHNHNDKKRETHITKVNDLLHLCYVLWHGGLAHRRAAALRAYVGSPPWLRLNGDWAGEM